MRLKKVLISLQLGQTCHAGLAIQNGFGWIGKLEIERLGELDPFVKVSKGQLTDNVGHWDRDAIPARRYSVGLAFTETLRLV